MSASPRVHARTLDLLRDAGVRLQQRAAHEDLGFETVGAARRAALSLALTFGTPLALYCDFDRALHWAEYRRDELAALVAEPPRAGCTVLGRTERAFASHPRVQRETEAIINGVFAGVAGLPWDVTGAARLLSRPASQAIVAGCLDDGISTDCTWPLFLRRQGFALDYRATEGLEFETADRYPAEVAAAGGLAAWIEAIDADPHQWAQRLELARLEVAAMIPYSESARS